MRRPTRRSSCPGPGDRPAARVPSRVLAGAPPGRDGSYWHVQLAAVGSGSGRAGSPELEGLVVRTVPVPDPGDLIGQLPGTGPLAWIRRGEGLVGWGEVARVTVPAGQDRFTAADKWLRALLDGARVEDHVGAPGCGRWPSAASPSTPPPKGSVLILPQVVLGRRAARPGLPRSPASRPPRPPGQVRWTGPGSPAALATPAAPGPIRWHDGSLTAPAMGAGGRGGGAADQGRPAAEGGAGPRPVRLGPRPASMSGCCWTGWPPATRTVTRSPAAAWSARPPSC